MDTADAILRTFESPNVSDSNMESANVVDVLSSLVSATSRIAGAITSRTGDETLTEAVKGVAGGLNRIAAALESLADAVRESY